MTPARRANAYLVQTGRRELTPRQDRRFHHKEMRRLRLSSRLPGFELRPADGPHPHQSGPAPTPTVLGAAGVGVTPEEVAR